MKAVVLVGGTGTRLRPLTLTTPKQMLPVAGRPMIERVLAHLGAHGVDEAVLSLGYRPDAFLSAYPDNTCAGVVLHYAVEDRPLDTAGAVAFAARQAGIVEPFLAVNGDVLTDLDIGSLIEWHQARGAEATIALTPVEDPSSFGVVTTDEKGRVSAFIEKPPRDLAPTNLINAGTYVIEPTVLDLIATDRKVSIEREVFPALVANGTLFAMASDARWIDAGTPASYRRANLEQAAGRDEAIAPDAAVDPGAAVANSVIGARSVVARGASISGSVLLDDVTVGPGATVIDSLLGYRCEVGRGAVVEAGSVLGDDTVVPEGTTVTATR